MSDITIKPGTNSIIIAGNQNQVAIETIKIHTDYYFISPAQILPEDKEAE